MSDGKLEDPKAKPVEKAPSLARKIAEYQGEPVEGRRGMAALHAHKQQYIRGVEYRFSEGEHGEPPLADLAAQRGRPVREYVGREQASRAMRKAEDGASGAPRIPKTPGSPLPADVKAKMEPKLGTDLSAVKVHTGGESAQAASGFGARAFTVGSDVHFGAGQYAPGTKEGDRLLAHELTHVVQGQKSGVQRKADEGEEHSHGEEERTEVSDPNEPAEKEADAKAEEATADHGEEKKHEEKKGKSEGKGDVHKGEGPEKPTEEKGPAISAKLDGVGLKAYLKPAASPAPKENGPDLAPLIDRLQLAYEMFQRWDKNGTAPKAKEVMAALKAVQSEMKQLKELQSGGGASTEVPKLKASISAKLQRISTMDESYEMFSLQGMSLVVNGATKKMPQVAVPTFKIKDTIKARGLEAHFKRQIQHQQDALNSMTCQSWLYSVPAVEVDTSAGVNWPSGSGRTAAS